MAQLKGKTTHYCHFDIDRDPTMKDIVKTLQSIDGGLKEEKDARKIATDISKYLYFVEREANTTTAPACRLNNLINVVLLQQNVEKLQEDGI